MEDRRPPAEVLRAFGATADPVRLAGGKGGTWRAGDVVLKPAEGDDAVRWRSEILATLPESPCFRIARPIRAATGDWLADGWEAACAVAGQPDQRRVDDVVRTGSAFHEAVAHLPRPGFLDTRSDPWAYGERLAWDRLRHRSGHPEASGPTRAGGDAEPLLGSLLAVRRPVHLPDQIVHGDLLGNVLFADGLPPAVIDWSAYWRPPAWASAVAVVDAMVWHGAGFDAALRWSHLPAWGQLLVRATIFRLATWAVAGWTSEPMDAYEPVVRKVIGYVGPTV
ncbi:TIGR02569 family protein [Couchioplanes caeruleus]|uniref:TIGR02569 family protein n=2 Tax=Couchioplanes caeruleus TaxID=56438 RepID=A0A1K0GM52_9ACTN|nr:TIGR02569 family protein [Couchioplanes caeruleus]OJF13406.1 TIGR02569 family protein [Couchioplanes caeruleus subsp. caeruleus]